MGVTRQMQYAFFFIYAMLLPLYLLQRDNRTKDVYLYSASCLLVLSVALLSTNTSGTDYWNYRAIFNVIPPLSRFSLRGHTEPGFQILISLVKQLGFQYVHFQILFQSFLAMLVIGGYRRITPHWLIVIWLYFPRNVMQGHLNQIRAVVVYAAMLYAIPLVEKKQLFKTIRNAVAAALFHLSALAIIPSYVVMRAKARKNLAPVVVIAALVVGQILFSLLFNIASSYSIRGAKYVLGAESSVSLLSVNVIRRLVLLLYGIWVFPYARRRQPYFNTIWNVFLLSIVTYFAFLRMPILAERISAIFAVAEPLMIISALYVFKERLFAYGIILAYGLLDVLSRGLLLYQY